MSTFETKSRQHVLAQVWFYTSQVLSLVGLAGILDDLKAWWRFVTWIVEVARSVFPALADLLVLLGGVARTAIEAWRAVLHPVFDVLLGWVPFTIPLIVKDLLLVALFVLTGWWRAEALWPKAWRRQVDRVRAIARRFGANIDGLYLHVSDATLYLKQRTADRTTLKDRERLTIEKIERHLGQAALEFAQAVVADSEANAAYAAGLRALGVESTLKVAVVVAAGIVVVFLVIDFSMRL